MNGAELKLIRQSLFLTQPELADVLGIKTARTVQYWEAGKYQVPDHHADRVRELDRGVDDAAFIMLQDFAMSADKTLVVVLAETEQDVINHWFNVAVETRCRHPKLAQATALRLLKLMRPRVEDGNAAVEVAMLHHA